MDEDRFNEDRLDEIGRRLRRITRWPWRFSELDGKLAGFCRVSGPEWDMCRGGIVARVDAEFIANAPDDIEFLLAITRK